jgi:hypothetical protein
MTTNGTSAPTTNGTSAPRRRTTNATMIKVGCWIGANREHLVNSTFDQISAAVNLHLGGEFISPKALLQALEGSGVEYASDAPKSKGRSGNVGRVLARIIRDIAKMNSHLIKTDDLKILEDVIHGSPIPHQSTKKEETDAEEKTNA